MIKNTGEFKMQISCGFIVYNNSNKSILLCEENRGKLFSIPKGKIEIGESFYETAIRELYEETGVNFNNLKGMQVFQLKNRKYIKRNKILCSFLLYTETFEDSNISFENVNKNEISKVFWYKLNKIINLKNIHITQKKAISEALNRINKINSDKIKNNGTFL